MNERFAWVVMSSPRALKALALAVTTLKFVRMQSNELGRPTGVSVAVRATRCPSIALLGYTTQISVSGRASSSSADGDLRGWDRPASSYGFLDPIFQAERDRPPPWRMGGLTHNSAGVASPCPTKPGRCRTPRPRRNRSGAQNRLRIRATVLNDTRVFADHRCSRVHSREDPVCLGRALVWRLKHHRNDAPKRIKEWP
jgi:hypothetical protein